MIVRHLLHGLLFFRTLLILTVAPVRSEEQTLIQPGELKYAGYAGVTLRGSPTNDQFGFWIGGQGGVLINSVLGLGVAGYGLGYPVDADFPASEQLEIGYGGFLAEWVFRPEQAIHGSASLLIGGGTVNSFNNNGGTGNIFFALEPGAKLELNLWKNFRVCPGVSYRWLEGESKLIESYWDISSFSADLTFKFVDF